MSGSNRKFQPRTTVNSTSGRRSIGRGRPLYDTNLLDCSLGFTPRNSLAHSPPRPSFQPVLHSPTPTVEGLSDSFDINSEQNINLNSNDRQQTETPFDSSQELEPIRLIFHQDMPNMDNATGGDATNRDPNTLNTTVNEFMQIMQATLKASQEEFRKEIQTISNSVSDMSLVVQALESAGRTNDNTGAFPSNQPSRQTISEPIQSNLPKIKDWNICYDGLGSVSDFIFKVGTLKNRTQCPEHHLLANFQILLSGKAETWYWVFMRQHQQYNFSFLKEALTKEFGRLETDNDVKMRISLRKQGAKESYDDFHNSLVSMNSRLSDPFSQATLISIIKKKCMF